MTAIKPELPRRTPNFDNITIVNDSVSVASGGDIAAAIATAVSTGKHRILLAAGGTYALASDLILPVTGTTAWFELTTDATLPALTTRISRTDVPTTYNLPILTFANGTQLKFAAGARRWRIRGLEIRGAVTSAGYDVNGDHHRLIQTFPDAMTTHGDLPCYISIRQCLIGGDDANHHGTQNRQGGVYACASQMEVCDSTLFDFNYGGLDYADQAQAGGAYAGVGPLRIENNNLWGSTETIAFGGASQFAFLSPEQLIYSDITIRKNHCYRPTSIQGIQGCANGIEFKLGRRILIEYNIVEGVWQETQNGMAFGFWSVNQDNDNPFTQTTDVTVRYNWLRNVSGVAFLSPAFQGAVEMARVHFHDNVCTGQGINPPCVSWRTFDVQVGGPTDVTIERNLFINTGTKEWLVTDPAVAKRWTIKNNLIGLTNAAINFIHTSTVANQAAWDLFNTNGDCDFAGNAVLSPQGSPTMVNPATNTMCTSLAAFGFVDSSFLASTTTALTDLSSLALSGASTLKGTATDGGDPGPDIATLVSGLSGVEMTTAERNLYTT